jgi:hypothetical protein
VPTEHEYPAVHGEQLLCPVRGCIVPAGQDVHAPSPRPAYEPAEQATGVAEATRQEWPAGQSVQLELAVAVV